MQITPTRVVDQDQDPIVRHPDGSIDLDHYLERGRNSRSNQARHFAARLHGLFNWRHPFSRRTLPAR